MEVPDWVEWVAQDEDGDWWAYSLRPITNSKKPMWRNDIENSSKLYLVTKSTKNSNWRESLRKA